MDTASASLTSWSGRKVPSLKPEISPRATPASTYPLAQWLRGTSG